MDNSRTCLRDAPMATYGQTRDTFAWSRVKPSGGNEKLRKTLGLIASKGIIGFGLPALRSQSGFLVCPFAGACAGICFACQGRYQMRNVAEPREWNLDTLLALYDTGGLWGPADALVEDLARKKANLIRIHDSGDFFSPWYLESWFKVAGQFPERRFYAYTKSHRWIDWDLVPSNFSLVQSEGGKDDSLINWSKPVARIFPTHADRVKAGYVDGESLGDVPAIMGEPRIGLVYHGTRNLTDAQAKSLRR